jgi:hypothetical protein
MIMYLFRLEDASGEVERNILLGSYLAWFAAFTIIGTLAKKGTFVLGVFASLPLAAVWLMIAWH